MSIQLVIRSDKLEFDTEKHFAPSLTLTKLKERLELVVGISANNMALELLEKDDHKIKDLTEEASTLEELGLVNDAIVKVVNTGPSEASTLNDSMPKYVIPPESYEKREDSGKKFREAKLAELGGPVLPPYIVVGNRIVVRKAGLPDRVGTIAFVGKPHFKPEVPMVGVVYDQAVGKNDGSIDGKRYFDTAPGHGAFVMPALVAPLPVEEEI